MSDMKQAARTTMTAQLVAKLITEHHIPVKADLLEQMTDLGVERVRVTDDDGTDLGAVSISAGRLKAKVVDDRAFTKWVAERYPSELMQVVRDAFTKKLLDEAAATGAAVDIETGEEIPGVEVAFGDAYLSVRPTADAKARMRETLQSSGLLQIAAGDVA